MKPVLTDYADRLVSQYRPQRRAVKLPPPRVGAATAPQPAATPAPKESGGMNLITGRLVQVLIELGDGLSYGYPNAKGLRILAAIGDSLTREERMDLMQLMDYGPPKTEKYWRVLDAMTREVGA